MNELFSINYNVTLEETEKAFTLFQRKFQTKRCVLFSIVYLIAFAFGVDLIIKNYTSPLGYMLAALTLGLTASVWVKPRIARKRLIYTLSQLNEETYTSRFYEDRIEISTNIVYGAQTETVRISGTSITVLDEPEKPTGLSADENNEEVTENTDVNAGQTATENTDDSPETEEQPEPTVIDIRNEQFEVVEDDEMFVLFYNRSLIYVYPKRCFDTETITKIHDYCDDKNLFM